MLSKPLVSNIQLARHYAEEGSKRNIEYHYDAGNKFYELFLVRRRKLDPSLKAPGFKV